MGHQDFWLTTLPSFVGELLAVALLVSPWLLLRRWKWGRLVMIGGHVVIAFVALNALTSPYFPSEDKPRWTLFLALPVVLILAKFDRRDRCSTE